MERRRSIRKRVKADVYLYLQGRRIKRCRALNLSTKGVFVDTGFLRMPKGTELELVFVLDLGTTLKMHRLRGVVQRVGKGGTALTLRGSALPKVAHGPRPAG